MQGGDIAGYHIRGVLEGLRALGVDVEQLLRDCNFDRSVLEDPEHRFPAMQVLMLWIQAEQRYGRPTFGFDLAVRIPLGKLELIDYLSAACPTAGAGIECLVHHARLCASGFTYSVENFSYEGEVGRRITADQQQAVAALPPSMAEYVWTSLVARFRQICGPSFRPVLWLRHRPKSPASELLEKLGRVPEVGDHEALFVPEAQWNLENPRRDPMLLELLSAHARDVAARMPADDFLSTVQGAVLSALHCGDPSITRVAKRLGLTPRTLQRRLESGGLSYQQLLDQLRQEMAHRYLRDTQLSIGEISGLLAYADPSAFGRAFRRWTGQTPAVFRDAQRRPREATVTEQDLAS